MDVAPGVDVPYDVNTGQPVNANLPTSSGVDPLIMGFFNAATSIGSAFAKPFIDQQTYGSQNAKDLAYQQALVANGYSPSVGPIAKKANAAAPQDLVSFFLGKAGSGGSSLLLIGGVVLVVVLLIRR